MGYQFNTKLKELPYLPTAEQLIAIADDVKANVQHRGNNFEVVKASYEALKKANGLPPSSKRLCRSGCITQMNKMLSNWLHHWQSQGGVVPKSQEPIKVNHLKPLESRPLIPLVDKRKELEEKGWAELNEMVKAKLNVEPLKSNGRASKKILIDELLK